jgi:hypothetical protein
MAVATNCFDKPARYFLRFRRSDGVVAQLVEHHNGIVGVAGSIPVGSTIFEARKQRHLPALAGFFICHALFSNDLDGTKAPRPSLRRIRELEFRRRKVIIRSVMQRRYCKNIYDTDRD